MDKVKFDEIRDEVVKEIEYLIIAISERNKVTITYELSNLKISEKTDAN